MAYCVPLGVPHSQFLSWDPTDQDKALAWNRAQRLLCQGCGTRAEEWKKDRDAYIGQIRICPGCARLREEEQNVPDELRGSAHVYLTPPQFARSPEEEGVVT